MEVELGNNPSFVWHSLLAVKDLIKAGSQWQIGDGKTIGVTSHAWLPNTPVFVNASSREMKVKELIDADTRQRDGGKIHALFDRRTCEDILAVPLN